MVCALYVALAGAAVTAALTNVVKMPPWAEAALGALAMGMAVLPLLYALIRNPIARFEEVRREAERAVRENERRFRGMFESAAVGMAHVALDGSWKEVNRRLCEMVGYRRDEIVGRTLLALTHPDDLKQHLLSATELLSGTVSSRTLESRITRKDGSYLWVSMTSSLQRTEDGEPDYFFYVVQDISKRKETERQLHQARLELERRVEMRTRELRETNERLREEIRLRERVEGELRKRTTYEAIIVDIIGAIHQSLELEKVFRGAVDNLSNMLATVRRAAIYMIEGDLAVLKASTGYPSWFVEKMSSIRRPQGFVWKTMEDEKTRYVPDASGDPHLDEASRLLGTKSYLCIPLKINDRTMGCVAINSLLEDPFGRDELSLLETIARQLEVAIKNSMQAQALRTTRDALTKNLRALEKKIRYETIVNSITQSIHSSVYMEEVFENAVQALSENVKNVKLVSLYMVEKNHAVLKAQRGYPAWFVERVGRIPRPKGFVWKTILSGKPRYVADTADDDAIGPAGRELGTKSYLAMPIGHGSNTYGCLAINSLKVNAFDEDEIRLLEVVSQQLELAISNAQFATIDPLTGLLNRKTGLALLDRQMKLSKRHGTPLSVGFADVDNLKYVNDRWGHGEGDRLIIAAAEVLSTSLRESDAICRFGGDEFVLFLVNTPVTEADTIRERIERNVREYNASADPWKLSLSLGFTQFDPAVHITVEQLIEDADRKMYAAKRHSKRLREA